ncbi:MAG: hypothetical protein ACYSUI_22100 [Planctomycetota bacterium]|jgi:hypothetical protein
MWRLPDRLQRRLLGRCGRLFHPAGKLRLINGDGVVNTIGFLALLSAWGSCPAPPANCVADFDESGDVGVTDFLAMLANWGPCH